MTPYRLPDETSIAGVVLKAANLARARAFYAALLGFAVVGESADALNLAPSRDAAPIITLRAIPDAVPKPSRTVGLYHVAILVSGRAALGKIIARLLAARYPLQGASDHAVSEALYLADTEGNGLEIYRDRPREDWRMDADGVAMTTEAMDVDGVLEARDTSPWTGIDPLTQIGHVHLSVSDLKEAEAFWVDSIGFDVMQRSYPGALFAAAGGYHHHLGLNTWAGKRPPPPNATGLESFALYLPGGITAAAANLRAQGRAVEVVDGRAVVTDPDGGTVILA
ncbi:MAG: VOC family protein [Anaerolineae bacterium]|nr:VOC family protein [Anaerolineae bacterium]NUQ04863.1 VOC family protein [Anaerolineae bacterium]